MALVALLTGLCPLAGALTFDDIQFWVGEGSNQAGLVIDWADGIGPEALAWGFRWDGVATGADMMSAIVQADANLYALLGYGGATVSGLGYDLNGSENFTVAPPSLTFPDSGLIIPDRTYDNRHANDPADHYSEGWFDGYWAYWLADEPSSTWTYSEAGMASRTLNNLSWDGWRFTVIDYSNPNWWESTFPPSNTVMAVPDPNIPTVVPEPATITLLGIGLAGAAWSHSMRRRSRA